MKDIILMAVYISVQSQYMPPCQKYFRTYASHPCCLLCCTPIPWQTFAFDYFANEILNEGPFGLKPEIHSSIFGCRRQKTGIMKQS